MKYSYRCTPCRNTFFVDKQVRYIDSPEACPLCAETAERFFNPGQPQVISKDIEPAYNPAIGKVITSKAHLKKELGELKARGTELIEVGNESPDTIHRHHDEQRKAKADARWKKLDEELGLPSA